MPFMFALLIFEIFYDLTTLQKILMLNGEQTSKEEILYTYQRILVLRYFEIQSVNTNLIKKD